MPHQYYPKGAEKTFRGEINLIADTIKVAAIPSSYTYSASHEFLSDLGTTIGTPQTLSNKTVTGGIFDADDPNFGALTSGSTIKALVLFKDTGNPSTSPLIVHLDQVTGLPFATNGGEVSFPWANTFGKIISLVPAA